MNRELLPQIRCLCHKRHLAVAFVFFATIGGAVSADSWTSALGDGSVLKVDPATRRATRYHDGGMAPMWDGTHRLEDGSVVIVRDGQAVPTEDMLDQWTAEPGAKPQMRERYCDQLVRKACGFHDECAADQPCALALQLLRLEREEQRRAPVGSGMYPHTESTTECEGALSNPLFPPCKASAPATEETTCTTLVDKVCGEDSRCEASAACDPARQLLQMETEERLESADPDARTATGSECGKAMDNAFFTPCE